MSSEACVHSVLPSSIIRTLDPTLSTSNLPVSDNRNFLSRLMFLSNCKRRTCPRSLHGGQSEPATLSMKGVECTNESPCLTIITNIMFKLLLNCNRHILHYKLTNHLNRQVQC